MQVSFAQPWTTSPGLYIPFSNASSSALFIQGQTAVAGSAVYRLPSLSVAIR